MVEVASGSKAAAAGLQTGDVIKEINHQNIKSVDDYTAAVNSLDDGEALQLFIRRPNVGFLVVKIEK